MQDIEPYYGWLKFYTSSSDPNSPFHEVEHSEFFYDRQVHNYLAHPQWDDIGSEGLLVKILYADYNNEYAILELFGVWNDLLENDYKNLTENCLVWLLECGITRFIIIAENLLYIYLDQDDYYEAFQEELGEGWICILRAREHVMEEFRNYGIDSYFYFSPETDQLPWRKFKPWELYVKIESRLKFLPE